MHLTINTKTEATLNFPVRPPAIFCLALILLCAASGRVSAQGLNYIQDIPLPSGHDYIFDQSVSLYSPDPPGAAVDPGGNYVVTQTQLYELLGADTSTPTWDLLVAQWPSTYKLSTASTALSVGQYLYLTGARNAVYNYDPSIQDPGVTVIATGIQTPTQLTSGPGQELLGLAGSNVYRIDPATGAGSTLISGADFSAIAANAAGELLGIDSSQVQIYNINGPGPATLVSSFSLAAGVTADPSLFAIGASGNIYVGNNQGGGTEYDSAGNVIGTFGTTVPYNPNKTYPATNGASYITVDASGNVFVNDSTGFHQYDDPTVNVPTIYWMGQTDGNWADQNWSKTAQGRVTFQEPGTATHVVFSDMGASDTSTTISSGSYTLEDLTVSDPGTVEIHGSVGNGLVLTGDNPLTVNSGSGLVSIDAPITLTGTSSPTIEVDNVAGLILSGGLSSSSGLTKSGSGAFTFNGTISGPVTVNSGAFNVAHGGTVNGDATVGSGGSIGGGGTVNGKITVGSGGSTYPGDPQILTATNVEYQDGSTAQFSIATTLGSAHPPVAGTDYDQINLTGLGETLTIDPGTTTLQLNMTVASLEAVQSRATDDDIYFLFTLAGGANSSDNKFSNLTLAEDGNTYTTSITGGVATFANLGLQLDLSYEGDAATNSMLGGNDLALTFIAIPEPGTWVLFALGMLAMGLVRHRKYHNGT